MTAASTWIGRFSAAHGRPPRILHLGNIANNAYQTAKMLRAAGADCDVLCADYYHIMGTPEWDDADFTGEVGSQSYPAWHRVNLYGFVRPAWFAQGPRRLAIAYLLAKRRGQPARAARRWRQMEAARAAMADRALAGRPPAAQGPLGEARRAARQAAQALLASFSPPAENPLEAVRYSGAYAAAMQKKLAGDAARFFPGRAMAFGPEADYYFRTALLYRPLLACYDIVQGYATEAIWPYLCGAPRYVAWEHGTLRTFPYEDNDRGRLLLLSYAGAGAVYVTNVDCYDSAAAITQHSGAPIVCGLHGFDTERVLQKQHAGLRQGGTLHIPGWDERREALFFCPARVDIDPAYGTYIKANDRLYRALNRLCAQGGAGRFKVLQLEWGNDTAALRRFLHTECPLLEGAVIWQPPLGKAAYYQLLQRATLVFDNFLLPLMGGNGIETLMSGHAALVNRRIPEELMLRFFPETWPVFAVEDEEDMVRAAQTALQNPGACLQMARRGQEWILACHSRARIVAKNCEAYGHLYPQV